MSDGLKLAAECFRSTSQRPFFKGSEVAVGFEQLAQAAEGLMAFEGRLTSIEAKLDELLALLRPKLVPPGHIRWWTGAHGGHVDVPMPTREECEQKAAARKANAPKASPDLSATWDFDEAASVYVDVMSDGTVEEHPVHKAWAPSPINDPNSGRR